MLFKPHYNLKAAHSFLSPSGYHWINYTDEHLVERFHTHQLAARGTALHELAHQLIELKVPLPKSHTTLNDFVNDVLGFQMKSEQLLYYSDNCFGTADAINFKRNLLRIFDLKTGVTPAHVEQLLVYAAIFCLEYDYKPFDINYDLRIYQNDEVVKFVVDPVDIARIMDRIKTFDKMIDEMRREEEE